MTSRERIDAAIHDQDVDRIPYTFWYHFPPEQAAGEPLVEAVCTFYDTYRPDLLKVMHDIPYPLPDGFERLATAEDWERLSPLDPETGNFGCQLQALRAIRKHVGPDVPIADTVFNPAYYARELSGHTLDAQMQSHPEAIAAGMRIIAQTLQRYASVLSREDVYTYLAVSGAEPAFFSRDIYKDYLAELDLQILNSAQPGHRIVHLHGERIYLDLLAPLCNLADIVSWSVRLPNPTVQEVKAAGARCIMTGINEASFTSMSPAEIRHEVDEMLIWTNGRHLIIAPGCSVPTETPPELLHAIAASVTEGRG